MNNAISSGQVQSSIRDCWELGEVPTISNLSVNAKDSKKKMRMTSLEGQLEMNQHDTAYVDTTEDVEMEQKEDADGDDDEVAYVNTVNDVDVDVDQILLHDGDDGEGGHSIQPGSIAETN